MIPEAPREDILAAIRTFDADLRDSDSWTNWESKKTFHRYAIRFEGRLYPAKEIISMATGAPTRTFTGGAEANNYLEARGFTIENLPDRGTGTKRTGSPEEELRQLVRRRYPGWEGYHHPAFVKDDQRQLSVPSSDN